MRIIFSSKVITRYSIWAIIRCIFVFYCEDDKYNTTVLEDVLKKALRLGLIFGPIRSRLSGMKFVVTITIISNVTLCLISNYNSKSNHSKDLSRVK